MPVFPKYSQREPTFLLYLSVLLLVFSVLAYFVLFGLEKRAEATINNVSKKLEEKKPEEIKSLEEEVKKWERKIKDFTFLLQNHKFPSQFFPFFEKKILPKVFIKSFDLDLENQKVEMVGETDGFDILGQQIMVLEREKISNLELSDVGITKEGKVEFRLKFNFDKDIINPKINEGL
jgi:hypothetical protein